MEAPRQYQPAAQGSGRMPVELSLLRAQGRHRRGRAELRASIAVVWLAVLAVLVQAGSRSTGDHPVEPDEAGLAEPTPRSTVPTAARDTASRLALSPSEHDLVAWARRRFAVVGLELPDVHITFHDDKEPCRGHTGRFQSDAENRRIAVCVPDRRSAASQLQRRRTLVHELAHAWDHVNLDRQDRADLLEVVDAPDWYAPELAWDERGVERFAETIVWGLYDQLRRPTLIDVPCHELHADFIAITGSTAPGPLDEICRVPGSVLTKGDRT